MSDGSCWQQREDNNIHCFGWISCSPAVVKLLCDKMFGIDVPATSVYNRYVYSMLEKFEWRII